MIGWALSGILCQFIGVLYPAYMSFKALETETKNDDTQWLTYWVIFAAFTVAEYFVGWLLSWFPFYYEAKIAFLVWLQHPKFNGAYYVYRGFLRPFLLSNEKDIDGHLKKSKDRFGDSVNSAATAITEKAMEVGTSAVGQMMAAVRSYSTFLSRLLPARSQHTMGT